MRVFIFVLCSLFSIVIFGNSQPLKFFQDEVVKTCPETRKLIIKKALISIASEEDSVCSSFFVKKVFETCPGLNCYSLKSIYQQAKLSSSGNIIGSSR